MQNPLTSFLQRFTSPAITGEVVKSDGVPYAVGTLPGRSTTLRDDVLGQPTDTNYDLIYAIYDVNVDVSGAVDAWIGVVTGAGWRITPLDPDTELTDALKAQIDEATDWLDHANPNKSLELLAQELIMDLGISGDGYWHVPQDGKGVPIEIWPVHPATMRIVTDEHGVVLGFLQRVNGKVVARFEADEIRHFRLPSRKSDIYGQAPLERALEEVKNDLKAVRANQSLFDNGFAPAAILTFEPDMKNEEREKLVKMLEKAHQGPSKWHKLMALIGVKSVTPWGHNLKDMEFIATRALSTQKVATAYGVPKFFLNQKDAADYATAEVAERRLYNLKGKTLQQLTGSIITGIVQTKFPELQFEWNQPDFSDPNELRKDALQAHALGAIDDNELRPYFGLEERTEEAAAESNEPDDVEDEEQPPDAEQSESTKSVKKSIADDRAKQMEGLADGVQPDVADYFTDQEADALESLPQNLTEDGVDDYLDALLEGAAAGLLLVLTGSLYGSMMAGAQAAQLNIGVTLTFDKINPFVNDYLKNQALTHVKGITNTTREQLRVELIEGIGKGESVDQLSLRVKSVFTEASTNRARTIAATETAQAFQYANYQAALATGQAVTRTWNTARDEKVREKHRELEQYTIRFDAKYPDGIEPGSEFNCRCTETYGTIPV